MKCPTTGPATRREPARTPQGVEYTRSLRTGWKAPLRVRRLSEDEAQDIRDRFHIIVEGEHLPPPIIDFADMKLPPAVRAPPRRMQTKPVITVSPHYRGGRQAPAAAQHRLCLRSCCVQCVKILARTVSGPASSACT